MAATRDIDTPRAAVAGAHGNHRRRSVEEHDPFPLNVAARALAEYFAQNDSASGLRSMHGALVDLAQQGARGTFSPASPEDSWTGDVWGGRRGRVRRCAIVARGLRQLDPRAIAVLEAYYGAPPWPGEAHDTALVDVGLDEDKRKRPWSRAVPPPEARRALGDALARVALHTAALARVADELGLALERALVIVCKSGGARCDGVETDANRMRRAALTRFSAAVGFGVPHSESDGATPRRAEVVGVDP